MGGQEMTSTDVRQGDGATGVRCIASLPGPTHTATALGFGVRRGAGEMCTDAPCPPPSPARRRRRQPCTHSAQCALMLGCEACTSLCRLSPVELRDAPHAVDARPS